jgi:hypothetical protein
LKKTYVSRVKNLLDGEHKEQSMQRSGQQQPNQQHQQPLDRAPHSHSESAHAGCTPNTQPSTAEPVGSVAVATTTTTLVY